MLDLSLAGLHHLLIFAVFAVPPTLAIARWRRSGTLPDDSAIRSVHRLFHYELALFALLPIFAAAMARGYGEF